MRHLQDDTLGFVVSRQGFDKNFNSAFVSSNIIDINKAVGGANISPLYVDFYIVIWIIACIL